MSTQRKNKRVTKKVLVLCRSLEHKGGVVNYYKAIFKHYKSNSFTVEHFLIGKRPGKKSNIIYFCRTLYDFIRLFLKLFDKDYILIHLNPSLGTIPVLRDSLFLLVAKLHSRKVLVFWRGWGNKFETWIENNIILFRLFRSGFDKADAFVVLSSSFKKKLRDWGFNQDIFLDTTTVDDSLVEGFSPVAKIKEVKGTGKLQILFLSRLAIAKGVIETIDAFKTLHTKDRELRLVIAGDGPDFNLVRKRVKQSGDDRIKLVGYVRGEEKRKVLESSHLMCFPTYYGEGLPNAILEAMAFGMPIITRPVGGIADNFIQGENGYYVQSLDGNSLSKLLRNVISDKDGLARMAMNNYNFARERFIASIVAKRLDNIYNKVVNG